MRGPIISSIALLVIACASEQANKPHASAETTEPVQTQEATRPVDTGDRCQAAATAIVEHSFSQWRGLPAGCTPQQLFAQFPGEAQERPKRALGTSRRSVEFVMLELEGYYRPTANLHDQAIVLFDGMNPAIDEEQLASLLASLGTPDATLNWDYGTLAIPQREYVFADRGITLFLNNAKDRALHIALYAATDLDTYLAGLRPSLRKTRDPVR